jgi:CDGSH-type Zn-finger protein
MRVRVQANGPYRVEGNVPIARQTIVADDEGNSVGWRQGKQYSEEAAYNLCRCGQSSHKPFCDGTHAKVGFDGTETAGHEAYLAKADEQAGPSLILTDATEFCAFARFCDVAGQIWNLVEMDGPEAKDRTVQEAAMCPSGRLVVWDPESKSPLEPEFDPSIGVVEDPAQGVAGPLWIRGGISVTSADGTEYERRNRVTLCRCGASGNKPFCDGSHAQIGFTD